MQTKVTKQTAK